MSDIGPLYGLAAMMVAITTVAAALLGSLVMLVAALVSRLPPGDRRGRRVLRFVAGPLAGATIGALSGFIVENTHGDGAAWLDTISPAFPVAAIGAWIALAIGLRRRSQHRSS